MEDDNNLGSSPNSKSVTDTSIEDNLSDVATNPQPTRDTSSDFSVDQNENTTESLTTKKSFFRMPNFDLKNMNKNTKLAISLATVLLVVGVGTFILIRNNGGLVANDDDNVAVEESDKKSLGASITLQEGTLQMQENGEWKDITSASEQTIKEGTSLRTVGATSRAVISFDDGSALRLDANSEAEFSELTTEMIQIVHVSGYTYNRVLPSESMKYVVTSNDAQYEAKGTAFITIATGDEQAVEVFHSSVQETSTNKIPKEGEKLTVVNKSNPSEDGKITNLDIEVVKNDSFMQWNIELDKKDENYKNTLGFLSDVKAPEITLNSKDGDVILLEPNATEGTIEISGSTESGAKVTVLSKSQSGATTVDVTVGSDGKFTTPVLTAPIGDSVFEFVAKDKTGNKTTVSLRIKFQKKSQPVAGNASSFILETVSSTNKQVEYKWTLNGIEAPDGFRVVYEKNNPNPVYKSGDSLSKPTTEKIYTLKSSDFTSGNGTYHIKVCIYDKNSDTCGQYSNSNTISLPLQN